MVFSDAERRVLLLRHGESQWNVENRWQGWADIDLTARGRRQAEEAAAHLRSTGLGWVAASDLARAAETASILAGALGLGSVEVFPEFRERDVGDWSGLTGDEIEAKWPGELGRFRAGAIPAPPGGEDDGAVLRRVTAGMGRLIRSMPPGPGAVVTHGGILRILERSAGLARQGTGNLCGRWFAVESGNRPGAGPGLVAEDAVVLPDPEDQTATTSL